MGGQFAVTVVRYLLGGCFILSSIVSRGSAIYSSGYNTYYWYDLVLNKPNAHFSTDGIYRCCNDPTYTLGRLHWVGVLLMIPSVEMFLLASLDVLMLHLFFVQCVEKPFVEKMYKVC